MPTMTPVRKRMLTAIYGEGFLNLEPIRPESEWAAVADLHLGIEREAREDMAAEADEWIEDLADQLLLGVAHVDAEWREQLVGALVTARERDREPLLRAIREAIDADEDERFGILLGALTEYGDEEDRDLGLDDDEALA